MNMVNMSTRSHCDLVLKINLKIGFKKSVIQVMVFVFKCDFVGNVTC